MKLVVGLGNPGSEYVGTRHNVGFAVIDELAKRYYADPAKLKFQATFSEIRIGSEKVLLVAPQTYMNRSGEAVWQFVKFFQLDPTDLVVICDDMNLPLCRLRWRAGGSAGGQNGLKDIIQRLGHDKFPRLRVGIGRPPGKTNATSWVLGRFLQEEQEDAQYAIQRAADSIQKWVEQGIEEAMNQFNRDVE